MKKLLVKPREKIIAVVVLIFTTGVIFLYVFDPNKIAFPQCVFFTTTGYLCPGCGSQRAIHSLLHLDFAAAFSYNALIIVLIPYLFYCVYIFLLGGKGKWSFIESILISKIAVILVSVAIIGFWLLRNIG